MRAVVRTTLSALVLALGFSVATGVSAQTRLRIAGNFASDHSSSVAMQQFKKEVESTSKGALIVDVFDNQQLGGAQENVTQTRAGTIDMTWVGMAFLSRTVPELEAVSLPFMFPTREIAYKVMDGPVVDLIETKMADKGFTSLGFMELGLRQVTNSQKPVKGMADLKGMKIRMQPIETHLATFRALGANPIAMDIKEVYSALDQKVIDGQDNPFSLILASRFFEVQKHVSNTGHFFDFIAVAANKKKFEALPADHQKILRTAMTNAIAWQRSVSAKADTDALAELQKKGMTYTEIPATEREAMKKATAHVVDDVKKRLGAGFVDQVLAEVKKAGG
ncbi:MAG: TRAP transporter substrate-binding protein [Moraxellaceae bacterium]|nr:TRAP transporter substrate-binding protein [Moraxellaceae bacterium]